MACPLTSLTRKGGKFEWTPAAETAFQALKAAFTTARVLRHFQPSLPLTIEADASDFGLGCVLSQTDEAGELHPLAYYSRKFCAAKLNYPIYDKELLAIVAAFRQWRVYLEGAAHPIVVYTDQKNLEYF